MSDPTSVRFPFTNLSSALVLADPRPYYHQFYAVSGAVPGSVFRGTGVLLAPGTLTVSWDLDKQVGGAWEDVAESSGPGEFTFTSATLDAGKTYRLRTILVDPNGVLQQQTLTFNTATPSAPGLPGGGVIVGGAKLNLIT